MRLRAAWDNESMRRRLVFAFFAAAVLFSMVREWRAPIACPRFPAHIATLDR